MNEKILFEREKLEKVKIKLKGIKVMVKDRDVIQKIDEVLDILECELKTKDVSIKDMIKSKMKETKFSNPELHFKLFMLYRKFQDGKISEDEALKSYELYNNNL